MFIGSINADLRALLAELAPRWRGRAVWVGCSGNFTVERILAQAGVSAIHGNDVSLYSCVLGGALAGQPIRVTRREDTDDYAWLDRYLTPGLPTAAALLLLMEYAKFAGRPTAFHQRMARAYETGFSAMHAATTEKIGRLTESLRLTSFTAGDVVPFVEAVPETDVVISFPPTYVGGYERLYKWLDELLTWESPTYEMFTPERFEYLTSVMREKATWVTMRDEPIDLLAPLCHGRFQTGARAKAVHVYSNEGPVRTTAVRQRLEPVPWARLEGLLVDPLRLVRLTAGQLNTLRSEYLAPDIIPSGAQVNLGLLSGDHLVGAMAFSSPSMLGGFCDAYGMSDFAIRPTPYRRLAKLVVAALLTHEVRAVLEQAFNSRVHIIGTTAFTKKPVSMKYRGLLRVYSRKEGAINYVGPAGKWSLEEALAWWRKGHATNRTRRRVSCRGRRGGCDVTRVVDM